MSLLISDFQQKDYIKSTCRKLLEKMKATTHQKVLITDSSSSSFKMFLKHFRQINNKVSYYRGTCDQFFMMDLVKKVQKRTNPFKKCLV